MDRILLTIEDIQHLLAWRDLHKDEVRRNPQAMKAVEIHCKESGVVIKGIRNGSQLSLHISQLGRKVGRVDCMLRPDGLWNVGKIKPPLNGEMFQDCLTVYGSLMALMVYGPSTKAHKERIQRNAKTHNAVSRSNSHRTTYILRHSWNAISVVTEGSHASPRGEFNVRGHFRHYKSGKVVWISEYRKGTGVKKRKTYKIGGNPNE